MLLKEHQKWIKIATQSSDCDQIPKVADAGRVIYPEVGKPYQVMHDGSKLLMESHPGPKGFYSQIIEGLRGHHEPQEEKVFNEVLKEMPPEAVMIELGSFWAYYSMWFHRQVQNPQTYMIEPLPKNLAHGQNNFKLNGLDGTFIQARIGRVSQAKVRHEGDDDDLTIVMVPQINVDDFLDQQNIDYVHLLHADIQTAEYEMLLGCEQAINAGKIGYIFISTHTGKLHRQCLRHLRDKGFTIIAEHSMKESYAIDGLIVGAANHIKHPKQVSISKRRPFYKALINRVQNGARRLLSRYR